jgi:hypothetical protein
MPAGNRKGPWGDGPMTGRAAGFCSGSGMPGYVNPVPGRGLGRGFGRGSGAWGPGFGRGRGWRRMAYATGQPGWMRFGWWVGPRSKPDPELEKQDLKDQAEALQFELEAIQKRLSEIESGAPEKA